MRIDRIRRRVARFFLREAYIGSSNYLDKTVADLAEKVGVEFDEDGRAYPVQAQEEPAEKPEEKKAPEAPKKEEAPEEGEEAPEKETTEEAPKEEAPEEAPAPAEKEVKMEPLPEDAMSLEQRIKKTVRDVVQKTRDQKKQPAAAE
jgi:hypothetical protein